MKQMEGCIQSLDWTSGLDWWTGLLDSTFFFFIWETSCVTIVVRPLPTPTVMCMWLCGQIQ